jgi:hypothetical protein
MGTRSECVNLAGGAPNRPGTTGEPMATCSSAIPISFGKHDGRDDSARQRSFSRVD